MHLGTQIEFWDLATGERIVREGPHLRDLKTVYPGRYVRHEPDDEEVAAYRKAHPEVVEEARRLAAMV